MSDSIIDSGFQGDPNDLREFLALAGSPIRSDQRESALERWGRYKLGRQVAHVRSSGGRDGARALGKAGAWTKGDYIKSLTAPAVDLRGAHLTDLCLGYADLRGVRFDGARFSSPARGWCSLKGAQLAHASLRSVRMDGVRLMEADLRSADLTDAQVAGADLSEANLGNADLRGADLTGAVLEKASLVGANVEGATLDGAFVYGVSAWDIQGRPASSRDLVTTPRSAPAIAADDLRVAQFIYLLINNPDIRDVLDTVTRKVVLLLGCFASERKHVLDALRDALRSYDLVPVLFDFAGPKDRDFTETVTLLARMARFVVADLTEPVSVPQELQAIAPDVAVPIRLIVEKGHAPYSMSRDLGKYHWVIPPYRYEDADELVANIRQEILSVAEAKRRELEQLRDEPAW